MRHAVIMAGGSGTRFWPASRRSRPKQFLSLGGGVPLLRSTFERLRSLIEPENIWVITGAETVEISRGLLPEIPAENIIGEPVGRDTAACVGLAATLLLQGDPEAECVVLPADHIIGDEESFRRALDAGLKHVSQRGGLMTFGLKPRYPATGFGYLRLGDGVACIGSERIHQLDGFVEKPDAETAQRYLDEGDYLWNAGIFAWRAADLLAEIRRQLPLLAAGLEEIAAASGPELEDTLARVYPGLPRISVDFGIMEQAGQCWLIPVDYPWSDVGAWPALREVLPLDAEGNLLQGRVLSLNCRNIIARSEGPLIAAAGLENLIIVTTSDAVLVLPISEAQRVKDLVGELELRGWDDVL